MHWAGITSWSCVCVVTFPACASCIGRGVHHCHVLAYVCVVLSGVTDRRYMLPRDPIRGHCQAGSLTGAVHLSKNNAGVLRPAQRGQKPRVEQKGKSWLDPGVQYAQGLRKHGLSILLA